MSGLQDRSLDESEWYDTTAQETYDRLSRLGYVVAQSIKRETCNPESKRHVSTVTGRRSAAQYVMQAYMLGLHKLLDQPIDEALFDEAFRLEDSVLVHLSYFAPAER